MTLRSPAEWTWTWHFSQLKNKIPSALMYAGIFAYDPTIGPFVPERLAEAALHEASHMMFRLLDENLYPIEKRGEHEPDRERDRFCSDLQHSEKNNSCDLFRLTGHEPYASLRQTNIFGNYTTCLEQMFWSIRDYVALVSVLEVRGASEKAARARQIDERARSDSERRAYEKYVVCKTSLEAVRGARKAIRTYQTAFFQDSLSRFNLENYLREQNTLWEPYRPKAKAVG